MYIKFEIWLSKAVNWSANITKACFLKYIHIQPLFSDRRWPPSHLQPRLHPDAPAGHGLFLCGSRLLSAVAALLLSLQQPAILLCVSRELQEKVLYIVPEHDSCHPITLRVNFNKSTKPYYLVVEPISPFLFPVNFKCELFWNLLPATLLCYMWASIKEIYLVLETPTSYNLPYVICELH